MKNSPPAPVKYKRALLSIAAILIVFLGIVVTEIISHKRDMIEDDRKNIDHELDLAGTLLRESLLRHDYATVEQFLVQWGKEQFHVVELRAVAPNGFVLAEHKREEPSRHTFKIRKMISYKGEDLIALEVVNDIGPIQESLNKLAAMLIAGAVFLTVVMGLALWYSLRRMVLSPLEGEISRRKQAEEEIMKARNGLEMRVRERTKELREERDRAQKYLDIAGVMFLVLDKEEKVRLINRKGCEILECKEQDIVGKNWFNNFVPGRMREEIIDVFGKLMAGEVVPVEYYENPVLTKGGKEKVIAWHNALLLDERGDASGTISSGEDITGRRKAEEELRNLFSTLNTLVNHMPEGVVLLDSENRVTLANPVGGKYLDILAEAEVGDLLTRFGGRPVRELLVSPPHILWHDLEANGHVFEVAGRMIGAGDAAEGIVFVMRDVTEDRKLGERIQIQERLAAVGQLAAGIAHDFNNILTVINGYTEMLLTDEPLTDKARHEIGVIRQSGKRAMDLIHQVLDFSRKTIGEMEPIELVTFVKEFLRFMRRTLPENINVSFDYVPSEFTVKADATKLQQVLANLAVNARDAMPGGGDLKITISPLGLGPTDTPPLSVMPPGDWITLVFSDTGKGIPADILPHIFEPFFTTKELGKGTGLGLSQVYGLVKQHEGYIDVKTGEEGSSFIVYLPAVKEIGEKPGEQIVAAAQKGEGQTVLVVEDENTVLELVKKVLGGLGYKALSATNGKEAFAVFRKHRDEVGLVITDVVMPEIDGVQLSRMIKKEKPSVKVVALSGYDLELTREEMKEAGVVEFIQKPFTVNFLAEAISRVLKSGS